MKLPKLIQNLQWPHRESKLEKFARLANHFFVYILLFLAGYLCAQIQQALQGLS